MDSKVIEHKRGADTTADLLPQQPPQMKDVAQKLSAVSSDEERLAVGVSTIELQTKRLSGAQRKGLTRERKMREGTWTVEKPPGKTPSPQAKGVAESSGGVKDPTTQTQVHHLKANSNPKNPGTPRCRLRHIRKLLLESRW